MNFVSYCVGRNSSALLSSTLYLLLSLFTFYLQCLVLTDFLWNNWFSSPISWLPVFKVSYSVTLRPSTIPSWVSNGSPETSNGSLDELRFPHSFILHLYGTWSFLHRTRICHSPFAFLILPREGRVVDRLCWIWTSVSNMEMICSLAICCTLVNLQFSFCHQL